jgi:hypothetical protein
MYKITWKFTPRVTLSFTICASLLLLPSISLLSEASQGQGTVRNARPGPVIPDSIAGVDLEF